jgi:hypothetical protein
MKSLTVVVSIPSPKLRPAGLFVTLDAAARLQVLAVVEVQTVVGGLCFLGFPVNDVLLP